MYLFPYTKDQPKFNLVMLSKRNNLSTRDSSPSVLCLEVSLYVKYKNYYVLENACCFPTNNSFLLLHQKLCKLRLLRDGKQLLKSGS